MLTAVQPGLRVREAAVANLASTAVANTVPGGGALGVGVTMTMQRSWGIPVSRDRAGHGRGGRLEQLRQARPAGRRAGLLAVSGGAGAALVRRRVVGLAVLVAAIGLFAAPAAQRARWRPGSAPPPAGSSTAIRRPFRTAAGRGLGRAGGGFRADVVGLLERRWIRITVTSLVSHLSLFAVLLVALRHVGVSNDEVSWQQVLAAFAFVRLLSAVPITPGGLGLVELGLTAALGSGCRTARRTRSPPPCCCTARSRGCCPSRSGSAAGSSGGPTRAGGTRSRSATHGRRRRATRRSIPRPAIG